MAHGNNRAGVKPKATFQEMGGVDIRFRHPFLAGQISGASPIDEIDISAALRLNEEFFSAEPDQDASVQEVLVDGSTVTITNHFLNGTMSLRVLSTTGIVGTGDFIAALHLIQSAKDTVGGTLTVSQRINKLKRMTVFWGVTVKRVPHLKLAGSSVVIYPVTLSYAGWIQGVSAGSDSVARTIWAVGNKKGISAAYLPYGMQSEIKGTVASGTTGINAADMDSASGDEANLATMPADYPNITGTAGTATWPA
jgi:hypothetical protein